MYPNTSASLMCSNRRKTGNNTSMLISSDDAYDEGDDDLSPEDPEAAALPVLVDLLLLLELALV